MYKKELQELCQKRQWGLPKYEASRVGPDHAPRFAAAVVVNGAAFRASGDDSDGFRSSKEAQNEAARLALLHYSSPPPPSSSGPAKEKGKVDDFFPRGSTSQPEVLLQNSHQKASYGNGYESEISMSKIKLQNFAQKRSMSLPEYGFVREGPPHAPRFKANVNVGNQTFESPAFLQTLKEAEHAAARVALEALAPQGPEDFCPFKSLLQEFCLKEGLNKPIYETESSGPSHSPVFICTIAIDGKKFRGEPVKTKKQAEILAAKVAWCNLKERQLCSQSASLQILKTQEAPENTSICSSVIVNDLSATDTVNSNTAQIFEPDSGPEVGYKNLLQCFAQRKNVSLPVYECIREGPSHAAAFKASVTINGQTFESTKFSRTVKDAEHAAAKIALETLAQGALDKELAPPFKSLLQEFCSKQGICSPIYETSSTGPSHLPIFTSIVKVDGETFYGKPSKSKKQAEILAAELAWSTLKKSKQQIRKTFFSQVSEIQEALERSTLCSTSVVINDVNENNEVDKVEILQMVTDGTGVKETGKSRKDKFTDGNVFLGCSSLPNTGIESAENLINTSRQDQPVDDAYASLQDTPDVYKDLGSCHRTVMEDKSSVIPEEGKNNFSVTNKILVYSRASNVEPPSGAVALPIQDDKWVAVHYECPT